MWVPKSIDWTSKPPCGTPLRTDGHWSVQGLVGCWLFNEGAGNKLINLANIRSADVVAANAVWRKGCLDFSVGVAGVDAGTIPTIAGQSISLIFAGNFYYRYSYARIASIQLGDRWLPKDTNPDGTLWSGMQYGYNVLGIVSNGSTEKDFGNGKLVDTFASYAVSVNNAQVYLGTNAARSTSFNGALSEVLIYTRALSPQEMAALSANPYQVCQP